jgi:hypothetical protein
MPTRSERGAPSFDKNQPNDLIRYFKELETLFTRCDVALDKDKKDYATSYVRSELADSWEAIPEFAATYEEFRDRLFEIYNQVSLKFILSDLDRLIGERQRIGMKSLQDLSEFHMRFYAISSYLMTNQLLSSREQSQSYLRVFDESLQSRILMRLQIKFPNHHPSLPYKLDEIYDAAKWILQEAPTSFGTPRASATPSVDIAAAPPRDDFVKQEQLRSLFSDLTKTISEALNANRSRPPAASSSNPAAPRTNKCMFDGCERFIRDCAAVDEYVRLGKCRRNYEGKVVLSTGAFVPRDIPGENLRDRIDEWHRRNPNQLAAGNLSSNTLFNGVLLNSSPPPIPTLPVHESKPFSQLSAQDRIAALESELFNLRVCHQPQFVPTIKTRKQRAAQKAAEESRPQEASNG